MMKPLKVGIAGAGIALDHIKAYLSLPGCYQLLAFCDIDEAKGKEVVHEFNIPRNYSGIKPV
jgi:predicted dehydrogenase